MADWNRKRLLSIGDAVWHCMRDGNLEAQQVEALSKIYDTVKAGTYRIVISDDVILKARVALCEVCEKEKLYECEKRVLYCENCEFFKRNSV